MTFYIFSLQLAVPSRPCLFVASDMVGGCGLGSLERGMSVDECLERRTFALRVGPYLGRYRTYLCVVQGKLLNREPDIPRSKWERVTGSTEVGYGGRLRGFRQASFVVPA